MEVTRIGIRPYIVPGVKGKAYIIVPLSEGSHIDRAAFNFVAHAVYNRPLETEAEVQEIGDLHFKLTEQIMALLKKFPPIDPKIYDHDRKFELVEIKDIKQIVYDAIKKHGDSFWQEDGQECLFDDIETALATEGFQLALIRKRRD